VTRRVLIPACLDSAFFARFLARTALTSRRPIACRAEERVSIDGRLEASLKFVTNRLDFDAKAPLQGIDARFDNSEGEHAANSQTFIACADRSQL
jgi:hypothetical protein